MSDASAKSGNPLSLATLAAAIGIFLAFLLILAVAYLPNRPAPITQGALSPAERKQKLLELRAREQKAATSYACLDRTKGLFQIPIERAMELTVQELNARK